MTTVTVEDVRTLISTEQMVERVVRGAREKISAAPSADLASSLLGSWIGIIHYEVLRQAQTEPDFLGELTSGAGQMALDADLCPQPRGREWTLGEMQSHISNEIGLAPRDVGALLDVFCTQVEQLRPFQFEPVGVIRRYGRGGYVLELTPDFLNPATDEETPSTPVVPVEDIFHAAAAPGPEDDWVSVPEEDAFGAA